MPLADRRSRCAHVSIRQVEAQLRAVGENMGEEMPQRIRFIHAEREGWCARARLRARACVPSSFVITRQGWQQKVVSMQALYICSHG